MLKDMEKERIKAKREMEEIKERIRHSVAERERQEELEKSRLEEDVAADTAAVASEVSRAITATKSVSNGPKTVIKGTSMK